MKLEIREDTDTKHFIELMEEIELSINLAMKVNKIMQVRRCLGILNVFHCEKFTYFDMLNYQKDNQIFKILLDRYFTQQIKRESVRIEDEEVSLDFVCALVKWIHRKNFVTNLHAVVIPTHSPLKQSQQNPILHDLRIYIDSFVKV